MPIDPDVQPLLDAKADRAAVTALASRVSVLESEVTELKKPHTHPTDTTAPPVPSGLIATAGDAQVVLNWADSTATDFGSFKVYRATVSAGPYTLITTRTTSDFINTGLVNGTTYFYKVSALDILGNESAQTVAVSATPVGVVVPPPPPPPPTTGTLIFDVDFEAGLEGIEFSSDADTLHDIILDPTPRAQGKVLRMTADTSDGNSSGNRARLDNNVYAADPQNLPPDATYEADFYLAQNQTSCNIFQFKQGWRHALAPHLGNPNYVNQTRLLLWFCRVQHVSGGNHEFTVRGKLYPNGQWWNPDSTELGTYQIAAAPGTPVHTGQWHHIECRFKWAGDNTGRIRVLLDGLLVCDVNQVTHLPLNQTGPEPDGINWMVPGESTWVTQPMQWTVNNYMTSGNGVWNPAVTANYFDNLKIRTP